MRTAFKEWLVVVDALGQGAQILIFRKGGLNEDGGEFKPDHNSFLLFPTRFHQQRESVMPLAQARYDELERLAPPLDKVRLEYYAEVMAWHRLDAFSQAEMLREQHIWRDDVIANRFDWGNEKAIHVLAVRVHRLALPVELPMSSAYAGCKSWVNLDLEVATEGSVPVLADKDFQAQLAEFRLALQPAAATP